MRALALAGALILFGAPPALARVRDVWVAVVPTWWNVAPNGHDAIMGMPVNPADAIFPAVVYRRYSPHWGPPSAQRATFERGRAADPRAADPRAGR